MYTIISTFINNYANAKTCVFMMGFWYFLIWIYYFFQIEGSNIMVLLSSFMFFSGLKLYNIHSRS